MIQLVAKVVSTGKILSVFVLKIQPTERFNAFYACTISIKFHASCICAKMNTSEMQLCVKGCFMEVVRTWWSALFAGRGL